MKKQPLFLHPVFQERIWGGTALKEQFGYDIPNDKTGECWAISAHPNGMGVVTFGDYKGRTLADLWESHPELFGNVPGEKFPLLTKLLDANEDLSVQVHPNDEYAAVHENGELGKTECWYIVDCKEGAEIIFGHNAKTKKEVREMIEVGQWSAFLRRVPVKPGDFFFVPSGTVHAIGAGIVILETQQSSDTTYRVYDYDRTDDRGNKRELHLEKSIDVITAPHVDPQLDVQVTEMDGGTATTYIENEFFTVSKWNVISKMEMTQDKPFLLVSVLNGQGTLRSGDIGYHLTKGKHFILPAGFGEFSLIGEIELIVSHV